VVVSGCEQTINTGAWVLGALDEHEAGSYEEHLRSCAQCRAQVALLRVPGDALTLATEQVPPPPELKDRIMRVVSAEAELLRAAGPEADLPPRRERRLRWSLRPLPTAALAAATLAVGVAGGVLLSGGSSQPTRTIQAQVAMLGAHATIRIAGDHAKLEVSGMRNPPTGRVYQVWVKRGSGAPEPTDALFTVNVRGHGHIEVPGSVKGVSLIMVTSEPQGGSVVPSGKPVITAPV
jgi:Anti-sigma-K factor rskA, C-terminal